MTLSPYALSAWGVSYITRGGNPLTKIHPSSYVFAVTFAVFAVYRAPGMSQLVSWIRSRGWLFIYLGSCIVATAYKGILGDITGIAALIDSFLVPSLVLLILVDCSASYRGRLASLVVAIAVLNALIGVMEARVHGHLFPYLYLDMHGKPVIEDYFRATALGGHPLRNAMMTACAMVALTARPWPLLIRFGCGVVLALGMMAFGGRSAMIVGLACVLLVLAARLNGYVRTGRAALAFSIWIGAMLGTITIAFGATVIVMTHFGARIVNGDFGDSSTMVRVRILDLLDVLDFSQLLSGYSFDEIMNLKLAIHILVIECFWFFMLIYLGVIFFTIWFIGFVGALTYVFRRVDLIGRTVLLCMLLAASTNVSLSSKNNLLDIVFALSLGCGFHQLRPRPAANALPRIAGPPPLLATQALT